jgi:hypothetical protein
MIHTIRLFLIVQAATFVVASLIHAGMFVSGYEHRQARIAESVIAIVLLAGLALTGVNRMWTRRVALIVQGFALLGTLVGLFTIAIGIGPRTVPDVIYHIAIVIVLIWGLTVAARSTPDVARPRT